MFNSLRLLALTGAMFTATVNDCSAGKSLFTLNSASVTPDVPKAGDSVFITLYYTVPDGLTVTDGTSEYTVTYNFLPLTPTVEPLCADVPCPLGPGHYMNQSETVWPTGVSGTLSSQMKWYDTDKDLLLCLGVTWKTLSNSTAISKRVRRLTKH